MPIHENTTQLLPDAPLDARVEALLFASGGALKYGSLQHQLGCSKEELSSALEALKTRLEGGATALVETDGAVALATAPSVAETVKAARKSQLETEIGQAGLEVLATILYRDGATRASIDYIRGVNSAATIRVLTTRGLIERTSGKRGEPEATYRATPALLEHLGVTHVSDIPAYDETREELAQLEARVESNATTETPETPSEEQPYDSETE